MPTPHQKNLIVPSSMTEHTARTSRPPVVVVMGHIDHGKSTLLDYIRKSNIVAGEAGGITQHMGAYQVDHISPESKKSTCITFLDTPGHAAFCGIRERGAQAADIAILAVSAEDGVKPQTVEAYKIIKDSGIPYIVAITKIDKPNARIEQAKQSLGEHEIYVEGWGGDIPCVEVSAVTGAGIPELLDMVMLVAELADLTTDSTQPATGFVIESTLDTRKGISATLLIKDGTLEIGSFLVAGDALTPVRFIENFKGEKVTTATASTPVRILGWSTMPTCGIDFVTVDTKKDAEKMIEIYKTAQKGRTDAERAIVAQHNTGDASSEQSDKQIVTIPLVIKADVIGSLEGVIHELAKVTHDKVKLKIISQGIGDINENDVKLAVSDPHIFLLGFNAAPDKKADAIIKRSALPISVKNFSIIYELTQYVKDMLEAQIPKEYIEESMGRAKIQAVFSKDRDKQVVGGKVESGVIEIGNDVRILRREAEIGRGKIRELQQQKKKAPEVREGFEFGTLIEAKIEIMPGDRVEAVRTVEKH